MNYTVSITTAGLAYTTTVIDPTLAVTAYQTDQTGTELVRLR